MKRFLYITHIFVIVVIFSFLAENAFCGSLEPTAPPAPTMKTLDEVKPGIPLCQSDFPIAIKKPGLYYFTENINLPKATTHAISVDCNDVTIDMMGYTLKGPDATSINGITAWAIDNVEIRNGTIKDFAFGISESASGSKYRIVNIKVLSNLSHGMNLKGNGHNVVDCVADNNGVIGIFCGDNSSIINCTSTSNGSHGIRVFSNCRVLNCTSIDNGSRGIQTGANSIIRGCVAQNSGFRGIDAGEGNQVIENVCKDNLDCGIYAASGCVITGNTAFRSSVHGIAGTYGCTYTKNTAYENGNVGIHGGNGGNVTDNTSYGNQGTGIAATLGCLVSRNTVRNNTGDGIYAANDSTVTLNNCYNNGKGDGDGSGIRVRHNCRVESNHVTANDRGIKADYSTNLIVKNSARANTVDYDIYPGNKMGPITSDPTTAGPWANFSN